MELDYGSCNCDMARFMTREEQIIAGMGELILTQPGPELSLCSSPTGLVDIMQL